MNKSYLISLLFVLLTNLLLAAGTISENNITVHNGLAHSSVQCIAQDKYGFIWFGTLNGLTRYDGYNLKNYQASSSNPNTISNNRIQIIYVDKNKDLWISTFDSAICKYNYDKDNFTRYQKKEVSAEIRNATDRFINTSILQASTTDKKYFIENNKSLLVKDLKTGKITNGRDVFSFRIVKQDLNCVYIDQSGVLWIGTIYNGVLKIDLNTNLFQTEEIILSKKREKAAVRSILKDQNKLYIGTYEDGLMLKNLSSGKTEFLTSGQTASNKVRSFFKDHTGDTWIGYNNGVDKIDGKTGKLSPMSLRGDVTRYDKSAWLQMQNLPNRNYFCIAEDPSGTIWLGTYNGIFRYNSSRNTFQYIDLSEYANCTIITSILPESANKLWISSEGGVFCIEKDKKKELWLATKRYHFEFGNPNSLPDDRVYSIQKDKSGIIWAGCENGLCRINPTDNSVKVYNQSNGLSDPGIAALLLDKHEQLWISHKKGISRLDTKSLTIKNYNIPAIDKYGQFLIGSAFYDTINDQLYFGYSEGYIWFSASEIHDNHIRPSARLVELRIDNQTITTDQEINHRIILKKPLYETSEIELTHKERSFSIEFSCTHYANPELNQFEYMLEGFDKNWIKTNADNRVAIYSGLQPGKYIFKIRAANANNIWSSSITQLQVNVLTPWWKTWWAITIFAAIFLGLLYLFLSMLLSKQKIKYLLGYEKLRAEQMEEVTRIRTNFFTNISHELRTPLTLIIDPLARLLAESSSQGQRFKLEIVKRNADRLLKLVNELLDVRKAEEGNKKIHLQPTNLSEFIDGIRQSFLLIATERGLGIDVIFKLENQQVFIDREGMETVLYNLLMNAFKNAKEHSTVTLSVELVENENYTNEIELVVANDGDPVAANDLQKIFEPFYQAASGHSSGMQGTGLGLTITRQLVELHGGRISADSVDGHTRFVVYLPYRQADSVIPSVEADASEQVKPVLALVDVAMPEQDVAGLPENFPQLLLIEDNADIRMYIKAELGMRFRVLEAVDGESGIEMIKTQVPDLVITDLMMPGISGIEVCAEIKNDTRFCDIPVIMLTARQSEESQIEGYETGADSYITKPFSIQVLEARINNLLNRKTRLNNDSKADSVIEPSEAENEFIARLKEMIIQAENYNVELLANTLSMSRSQLYRKIKTLTNQSATDFISEVRMNYACELLAGGNLNISEIAQKLGYSEQANFSRSFYRRFGVYPTHYLSQNE